MARQLKSVNNDIFVLLNFARYPKHEKNFRGLQFVYSMSDNLYASDGRIAIRIGSMPFSFLPGYGDIYKSQLIAVPNDKTKGLVSYPHENIDNLISKARKSETHDEKEIGLSDVDLICHLHKKGILIDWTTYGPIIQKIKKMDIGMVSVFTHKSDKEAPILIRFGIPSGMDSYYGVVNIVIMPVKIYNNFPWFYSI